MVSTGNILSCVDYFFHAWRIDFYSRVSSCIG